MRIILTIVSGIAAFLGLNTGAHAENCAPTLKAGDVSWFVSVSRSLIADTSISALPELLEDRDAHEAVDPLVWLRSQVCPFETGLSASERSAVERYGDIDKWSHVANSLYLTQIVAQVPDYFDRLGEAAQQFSLTDDILEVDKFPSKNSAEMKVMLEEAGASARLNMATVDLATLVEVFGPLGKNGHGDKEPAK